MVSIFPRLKQAVSRLSTLRFKAAWITVAIFLIVEIVARLAPLEYGMGAGVFLTNHRRAVVDGTTLGSGAEIPPDFDYIIFGESRSLSLSGHAPTPERPYSVYNLSLPAMGSRYYAKYLRKYLAGHNRPPAAVIFAADPGVFQASWARPLHDQGLVYSDGADESLAQYLSKRATRRVAALFQGSSAGQPPPPPGLRFDDYSHRFLHLFSPGELIQFYTGAERLLLLREALPLQYYSYRFRDSIRQNLKYGFSGRETPRLPAECDRCDFLDRPECRPELSNMQDNHLIEARLERTRGGINLGDRLTPLQRLQFGLVRAELIASTAERFERIEPELEPLADFLSVAREAGIKVVMAPTPSVEDYRGTAYYRLYAEGLAGLAGRFPDVFTVLEYPRPFIPGDRFVDQIHYDCPTAKQVSDDFHRAILPRAIAFAPYTTAGAR
ncbi:MAG: hypothetical protein RIF32_14695 [Leptospirales bacterium]|jgi:hypothetical protein